jgi:NADH-quinone oxidoreductase subunit N
MYFDEPVVEVGPSAVSCGVRGILSVNGLLILLLGILPGGLMALCVQAVQGSLLH